jgi:hypothetical protein
MDWVKVDRVQGGLFDGTRRPKGQDPDADRRCAQRAVWAGYGGIWCDRTAACGALRSDMLSPSSRRLTSHSVWLAAARNQLARLARSNASAYEAKDETPLLEPAPKIYGAKWVLNGPCHNAQGTLSARPCRKEA